MLLRELNLAAEERSAFLECGRPDAVLAAIRTDAGFSAAEEDKVATFGVASVDHGFTSLLLRTVYHRESPIKLPFLQEHGEVWYTDSTNHKKFVWEYQKWGNKNVVCYVNYIYRRFYAPRSGAVRRRASSAGTSCSLFRLTRRFRSWCLPAGGLRWREFLCCS